jgi:hypothetical protein
MTEKYGTNISGLTAFEGDVSTDSGASLIDTDSDGATALLFGPAAIREIQAGVANGDFAIPPDDADSAITDENPLPYFSVTDASGGAITAAVKDDASAGSGNVLRFTVAGGTTSGNSLEIERFVPVPATRNQAFLFVPEAFCINATATANARVTLAYQFYELDQTTTTGTGDSTFETFTTISTASTIRFTANQLRFNAPPNAAFIQITLTVSTTGTVASTSTVDLCELRLITGNSDLFVAERTAPTTKQGARIVQESGVLKLTPAYGGSGSITLDAATTANGNVDINVSGAEAITSDGYIAVTRGAAGNTVIQSKVSGDSVNRFLVEVDGSLNWGNGSSARDVNLYRSSSTMLETDDAFTADFLYSNYSVSAGNGDFKADGPTTTSATTNDCIFVLVGGSEYVIRRYTSSSRYKTNIVPADAVVLEAAKRISPKHFESTIDNPQELGQTRLGFIAEEIHEAGLTHAVAYNADGQPESIDSVALIAALWHRVNDLESRLKALETE